MSHKLEKRSELLSKMTKLVQTWDGTSLNAEKIILQNSELLAALKRVDMELDEQYSLLEQKEVAVIIEKQQSLVATLKQERSNIMKKMKQVNQKDKIVNNYYSSIQQSIFVDRGM